MARPVKCLYCGKPIDRDNEKFIQIGSRYAHLECHNAKDDGRSQLLDYVKELFGERANFPLVAKQIKQYQEEFHYSYTGMYKCLKYAYEIKREDISKAQGVGVIPIYWLEARNYFYEIYRLEQLSQSLNSAEFQKQTIEIEIPTPQPNPKHKKKHFTFLDEGVEEDEPIF